MTRTRQPKLVSKVTCTTFNATNPRTIAILRANEHQNSPLHRWYLYLFNVCLFFFSLFLLLNENNLNDFTIVEILKQNIINIIFLDERIYKQTMRISFAR